MTPRDGVAAATARRESIERAPERPPARRPESYRFLGETLFRVRWLIILAVLLIILIQPVPTRTGHPIWAFVLLFAGYNLLVELLRHRRSGLRSFTWVPLLDLPLIGVLYYFDAEPTGPLFAFFFLAIISAAVTMPLWGAILYVAGVLLVIVAVAPTLPLWDPTAWTIRGLGTRLVVLTLVGVGTALLTQRLGTETAVARSMRDRAERLEELDRLRAGFVSTISHDLRTPLTAARAGLGMLETSAVDRLRPTERELLGNVRRSIDRLGMSIDDLLAVNQIEAGVLRLEREPLDLRSVTADAMAVVHPLMREKGQRLELDLPEPLPIRGDRRRLEQVLVNLLASAHRHTPGGTRIGMAGRATDGELVLSVSDDGPGIPAREQDGIFRRFYRLDPAGGASGLGLAIARSIVELHDGRLWVESELGQGATFQVALPRREDGGAL